MFMSVNSRAATAYKRVGVDTSVATGDPRVLIQLLFDGALESLAQARGAMMRNDMEQKLKSLDRCIRLIGEGLKGGLNMDQGGELAGQLDSLYDYCVVKLMQAKLRNDVALVQEVSNLLKPVSEAWQNMGQADQAGM